MLHWRSESRDPCIGGFFDVCKGARVQRKSIRIESFQAWVMHGNNLREMLWQCARLTSIVGGFAYGPGGVRGASPGHTCTLHGLSREGPKGSPQKGYPWSGRFLAISLRNYCIKCPKKGEIWPFHGYPLCGYPFWSSSISKRASD